MADQVCKVPSGEVLDILQDTFVLGLEVAEGVLLDSPDTVRRVLESEAVKKALESALRKEAQALLEAQAKRPLTVADGTAVVQKVGKAVGEAAKDELVKTLRASDGVKKLEQKLADLKCAFDKSPVGVFVSENKTVLYIVAAGVAVGGVGAMYATWWGDDLADPLTKLASNKLKFKVLGNVELGVGKVTFKPSTRTAGVELMAAAKWKRAEVKLEMSVTQENGRLTEAGGTGTAMVQLTDSLKLTAGGGGGVATAPGGGPLLPKFSASLALTYTGTGTDQGLAFRLYGKADQAAGGPFAAAAGGAVTYAPKRWDGFKVGANADVRGGDNVPTSGYVGLTVGFNLW